MEGRAFRTGTKTWMSLLIRFLSRSCIFPACSLPLPPCCWACGATILFQPTTTNEATVVHKLSHQSVGMLLLCGRVGLSWCLVRRVAPLCVPSRHLCGLVSLVKVTHSALIQSRQIPQHAMNCAAVSGWFERSRRLFVTSSSVSQSYTCRRSLFQSPAKRTTSHAHNRSAHLLQ